MQSRILINLFLVIFAIGTLIFLFKYTDILNTGFTNSLDEGVQSLKRIIQEKPPQSALSETEKDNLKKTLDSNQNFTSYFCGSTFFPFIPGAIWNYQVTSGSDRDVIKMGIPGAENGTIYLDGHLASSENWTNRTIAACKGNKIFLTDLNFMLIFMRGRTVTTPCQKDQYNFSLPQDRDLIKGNAWLEKGCLIHDVLDENYKEKQTEIKEDLEVRGRVLGQEDITVPAGTFTAEKVELALSGRQEVPGTIKTVESIVNIWITQGVGIVKTVYQEKGSDKPVTIQELLSFQIPTESDDKINIH